MSESNGLTLARLARERSRFYLLLSAGFSPPTATVVRRLSRRGTLRSPAGLIRTLGVPSMGAPFGSLSACCSRWQRRGMARVAGELRDDYHRLFVGPYHLEAPPYESCYRGPGGVMGEAALGVLRSYEDAGVTLSPEVRELPDHIALELAFLGLLAGEEARLRQARNPAEVGRCLERQERFLTEHLVAWITPFSARVRERTRSRFYRALAGSAADYVAADAALVGALGEAL